MLVLGFSDYQQQGEALALALGVDFLLIELHRFPHCESQLTQPPTQPTQVIH